METQQIWDNRKVKFLNLSFDSFLDMAYNLKINVIAYDYTGYGISTGKVN